MRHVCFNFALFRNPAARRASERVMRLMLEALTQANELYLSEHPHTPWLYQAGIPYQHEPPGAENWDGIPKVLEQGWGDCEDLVAWRCAELRVRAGLRVFPDFVWREITRPDGTPQIVYHILVRFPDGRFEDPSRLLGMGQVN